jgi:hypothetical protein
MKSYLFAEKCQVEVITKEVANGSWKPNKIVVVKPDRARQIPSASFMNVSYWRFGGQGS